MSWFSWKKPVSKNARRRRPVVETLETRLNLAGNVAAVFLGGNLTLTGDALDNTLRIVGNGPGVFEVRANMGTALNGVVNGMLPFAGVNNITLNLNNGNDQVRFVRAELPGRLTFNGGNGNDTLFIGRDNNEDQFFGSLSALLGAGDDTINVDGEDNLAIPGLVSINGGDGNNTIDLDPDVSLTLGVVSIVNGKGNDTVDLGLDGGSTVNTRSITVNQGAGNNTLFIDGDVTINGSLAVIGLGGNDLVLPADGGGATLDVLGSVALNLGDGANNVSFLHTDTFVQGAVAINTGKGIDTVEFLGDTTDIGVLGINTGLGDDQVDLLSATSTLIRGSAAINTLTGNDTINVFATEVRGAAALNTGEGDDFVFIDNSIFRANVAVTTAGGNDEVNVEAGGFDDGVETLFAGPVVVDLGAGNDTINIGFDADDFAAFLSLVTVNGGLGIDDINDSGDNLFTLLPTVINFP